MISPKEYITSLKEYITSLKKNRKTFKENVNSFVQKALSFIKTPNEINDDETDEKYWGIGLGECNIKSTYIVENIIKMHGIDLYPPICDDGCDDGYQIIIRCDHKGYNIVTSVIVNDDLSEEKYPVPLKTIKSIIKFAYERNLPFYNVSGTMYRE